MAYPNKVGMADALRQRELDDEDRESSQDDQLDDDWETDSPNPKKATGPARRITRPGERSAPAPPTTRPGAATSASSSSSSSSKAQPSGAPSEKRGQSELSDSGLKNKKRACDAYEVDLAATEFSMCKCGFKKSDHVQGAAFRAPPRAIGAVYQPESKPVEKKPVVLVPTSNTISTPSVMAEEDPAVEKRKACDGYEIDLNAQEFGTCKCGMKKVDHTKAAIQAGPKARTTGGGSFSSVQQAEKSASEERHREIEEAKKRAEAEERARQDFLERERQIREYEEQAAAEAAAEAEQHVTPPAPLKVQPTATSVEEPEMEGPKACDAYEIDLNAAEFGTCKCGFKKTDHTKTALFAKPLPKAVHAPTPISVPKVQQNRAPPAFATTAKQSVAAPAPHAAPKAAPAPPPRVVEEPHPAEEEEHVEEEDHPAEEVEGEEQALPLKVLDPPELYRAKFDFEGQELEDLSFQADNLIEVFEIIDPDWMRGRVHDGGDHTGVFPTSYVEKYEEHHAEPEMVEEEVPVVVHHEEEEEPIHDEPEVEERHQEEEEEEHVPVVEEERVEEIPAEEVHHDEAHLDEHQLPFTAYALYDFTGESEDDLPFQANDVIEVTEMVDEQWWRGTCHGREGIFPVEYVSREQASAVHEEEHALEEIAPLEEDYHEPVAEHIGFVVAQFDLHNETEDDLEFATGDCIQVLEVIDDDWIRGALNGREGLVPRNYVGPIQE